jgi:hypothetical protein
LCRERYHEWLHDNRRASWPEYYSACYRHGCLDISAAAFAQTIAQTIAQTVATTSARARAKAIARIGTPMVAPTGTTTNPRTVQSVCAGAFTIAFVGIDAHPCQAAGATVAVMVCPLALAPAIAIMCVDSVRAGGSASHHASHHASRVANRHAGDHGCSHEPRRDSALTSLAGICAAHLVDRSDSDSR